MDAVVLPLIMLVDDNKVNQTIAKAMLERLGYRVLLCDNGKDAIDKFEHYQISLILMDCSMPLMDGFEATRVIRARHNSENQIPILAFSATINPHDYDLCIKAGMNDFVHKPMMLDNLREKLSQWIRIG